MKKQLSPLGKAISFYLIEECVSWDRLSMLSGVNEGTLSKLKRGITSPTLYTIERISKALNVTTSKLIKKMEEYNDPKTNA